MAALSGAKTDVEFQDRGYRTSVDVTAAKRIYQNAILQTAAAGTVEPAVTASARKFGGIALAEYDNSTGAVTTSKPLRVQVGGRVWLPLAGVAATNLGAIVYASNDNDLTLTVGTNVPVGTIIDIDLTLSRVLVALNWAAV